MRILYILENYNDPTSNIKKVIVKIERHEEINQQGNEIDIEGVLKEDLKDLIEVFNTNVIFEIVELDIQEGEEIQIPFYLGNLTGFKSQWQGGTYFIGLTTK